MAICTDREVWSFECTRYLRNILTCRSSLFSPAETFGGLLTSFCFKVTVFDSLLRGGRGLLGIRNAILLRNPDSPCAL